VVGVRYGTGGELALRAQEVKEVTIAAAGPGFAYYDTRLHVLRFRSRGGRAAGADPRVLGSFVEIELDAERRK
jgi:hypothetical protein